MLIKVIACDVAFREWCYCAARSKNVLDFEFVTQGYHDTPKLGRAELQRRIDAIPAGKYDAIALGYALCSNIVTDLVTVHTPLVIPRAHDCISFFLGSKERYQEHFTEHPGTYYYTSGWLECRHRRRDTLSAEIRAFAPASQAGAQQALEELIRKYGEENARYLFETMGDWSAHYSRGALIDFEFTQPLQLRAEVQRICSEQGWQYEEVQGDLSLFQRTLDGEWDPSAFLVVPSGHKVVTTFDEGIIGAVPLEAPKAEPPAGR